jgi:hypothetical protein
MPFDYLQSADLPLFEWQIRAYAQCGSGGVLGHGGSPGSEVEAKLPEWRHHWNWHRPHTALGGQSPIDRVCERLDKTLLGAAVEAAYDGSRERIGIANFRLDTALAQLK